jgi:MoaA/NifB/PqqE/SkfB family radical SAM enzyme
VPQRYNYFGIFLTLRCNLNCSYCINKLDKFTTRAELTTDQWIEYLNRLELNEDQVLTLEGGEPSLHPGFYDIVENVNHKIDILTNLSFDIDEFTKRISSTKFNRDRKESYKSIRVSYHKQNQDALLGKAAKLQDAGFSVGLFSVNLPEKTEDNMEMAEKARQQKVYYFIKDFLGYKYDRLFGYYQYPNALSGVNKEVECRIKELLISPNGDVHRCHRDLYADEGSVGNITQDNFEIKDIFRRCPNYGSCSPCDVKLKTNRFLEMGSCSVEIKQ